MIKKLLLPTILALLIAGFWASAAFQVIAAGVAIFMFGMLMLEDGFKLFSGGFLERILAAATKTTSRALGFGMVATSLMQSSSLVSVITISFLSAGLITLGAGVAIIFGANIGTTTGAWLVAGLGLKVDISAYAMPMLALAIVLVFQSSKYLKGIGFVLAGMGFLFLGIHYMKTGFEDVQAGIDLTRFAMTGVAGLLVYTAVGAVATVVMQSSHATMVLTITALAAGQVTYENALALAIGSNIGTTITAMLGAVTANYQGRRLALAHLVFNLSTATVALILIRPLLASVNGIADATGIAPDDYTLKLALFHTLFNLMGVAIMMPLRHRLIAFLERTIPEPMPDVSKPLFLTDIVDEFPETLETALRNELRHLLENASETILHALNLHRHQLAATDDIAATVEASHAPFEIDVDAAYQQRVKVLHAAILEFTTRIGAIDLPAGTASRIHDLRDASSRVVSAVKAVKHMRRNVNRYTQVSHGTPTMVYNELRTEIARVIVALTELDKRDPATRSALWLDDERVQMHRDQTETIKVVEGLIRQGDLTPSEATSVLNDTAYAFSAMSNLLEAAKVIYAANTAAIAQVEDILSLDQEDAIELAREDADD